MKNIIVIAKNTFRETIRDRILYGILGFGVLYIFLDLFLAKLALGDNVMIRSFGLAGIYVFGIVITIFLGASIIYKEIERRTLYFVLSKPVSRSQVVLGKFLGLFAAVTITTILMAVVYVGVIFYQTGIFDWSALIAVALQIIEQGFFIALLIFFSSVAAPLTSTMLATMILFSGHLLDSVLANAKHIGGVTFILVQALYYLLPNLQKFDVRGLVVHNIQISAQGVLIAFIYALIYSILLLFVAGKLLERREL
jgi:Cu-processing system permease protein